MKALHAAIEGGADAVYFGAGAFNARQRAENFDEGALREAVALCHAYGVSAYVAQNTLYTDREESEYLHAAEAAYRAGVDALIVADLGGAQLLHRAFPDLALHASTQCSGHNVDAAKALGSLGFCRMVPARELPRTEIERLVRESGMEIEIFIHGAHCVSHSGQCLFSSLVGGRSGNRGACAQPCRLPDAKGRYPLSLKDMCLAGEIPTLIEMGVSSLKIEGRLKAPEYVREVTAIYRRLLDEGRAADRAEISHLSDVFSRSGFTDAYFKDHISHAMLGVRTEADKQQREKIPPFEGITRKIPLDVRFLMRRDTPLSLTLSANGRSVTVTGDVPLAAQNAPMDAEGVKKNLCRFGGTPYTPAAVTVDLDAGLMVPVSRLNALRREALAALAEEGRALAASPTAPRARAAGARQAAPTARFEHAAQITPAASAFFAHIYLPLHAFAAPADGVVIPPVVFDRERADVLAALKKAVDGGAKHALVGNIGHLALAREAGLVPHADFRLNICNERALSTVLELGFADALLSPELTLPQIRDIGGACDAIVYGRVPLMLLEKCAGREVGDCRACAADNNALVDRQGERFPILRLPPHRNILVNSRPTVMSDKRRDLAAARLTGGHYLFTVETPAEVNAVIAAYQNGTPLGGKMRRI